MIDRSCPELRAAALDGRRTPDENHLRSCPECAGETAAMKDVVALIQALDPPPPDRARLDEMHGALLALPDPRRRERGRGAAVSRRVPSWVWGVASAAAVVIVAAGVSLVRAPRAPLEPAPLRAVVQSSASTRYVHRAAATPGGPERVELHEGQIHLEVQPLLAAERLVIATDDAEVEARGTVLEVIASAGALSRVRVLAGKVDVRWRGAPEVHLEAGQTWTPPSSARVTAPVPSQAGWPVESTAPAIVLDAPRAEHDGASAAAAAPDAEDAEALRSERLRSQRTRASERAFRDGWAAFARNDMGRSAELFAEVERLAPTSALAEDALYGRCVALERADRRTEAVTELRRYLGRYPSGARVDEVTLALAAFQAEAGARDEARRLYTRVLSSPVDTLRARARAGLDALGR